MIFYLGTHIPSWLGKTDVPLFVSRRTMFKRKTFPRALGRWALDSGGFSELSMYGEWKTSPEQYVDEVYRFSEGIGNMDWAAIQDHMCEPAIRKNTGESVETHQRRTVESLLTLRGLAPDLPWTPVLQGWELPDYAAHVRMYEDAGVDIASEGAVGLGSVCRRQASAEIASLIRELSAHGLKLHGFGVKQGGLKRSETLLASADSMAWSFGARYNPAKLGAWNCRVRHKNCANCLPYALKWREELLTKIKLRGPSGHD